MDKNKHQSVRIYEKTLERIRKLAKLRNTTIPRMIDEMSIDYEMDLNSLYARDEEMTRNDRIIDHLQVNRE